MNEHVSGLHVRRAVIGDVEQMARLHIAASRRAYAGLIPDRALDAIGVDERARRWAQSLATAGPNETILVGASKGGIAGLGHCGPQRTPALPFPGEFFCVYVAPGAQQQGVGTALMIAMARFLADCGVAGASLWVARDNLAARRFYERLGGTVWAEKEEARPDFVLPEVAYVWRELANISARRR
ncbi:GNAT family N-acetyltransferase [Sphingomonas sp.]|uniref:GNAT family N-acetyltransferase n=1 Tax=Sphingomonas sp. TaxID=28214 RepID=UPI0025D20A92|nr:GNAT family N-acetyltransferase [Sphingomonas sp.]MBV9528090.1 GNAT family N-acetyltransferase [Sphingomonas sp.]